MDPKFSTLGVNRLVEKQLRNWEIRKAQLPATPESAAPNIQPYIAISRMVFSGGSGIAAKLHQHLGWLVVDQQILDYMARDDRVRRTLYHLMDERDLGIVNEMLLPVITGMPSKQQDYCRRLAEAALSFAQTESAIFLGRGIGYILPPEAGLHVRIVAGADACAQRLTLAEHLDEKQARSKRAHVERERCEYLTAHFGEDALEPHRFDMVLSTDHLTADQAVDLILHLAKIKLNLRSGGQVVALEE